MNELNQLRDAILDQVHARGQRQLQQAKVQQEAELKRKEQQVLLERETIRQRRLDDVKQDFQRQAQQAHYQQRQANLVAKQTILTELFEAAQHEMENWNQTQLLAFIQPILTQYQAAPFSVAFGEQTQATLGEKGLAQLQKAFPTMSILVPIRHAVGFVVSVDRIDYNYLFDELIQAIYQQESYQIASQIFAQ